ncbi:HAD family hydrolase [Aliiroseovarius sp. PTFE2010]|uniref:HAD family hydrolase n=1 Tax=Aliiroseovarius sp. PTFE2010 TaxID=3417190 RepID=UPI003CE8CFB9
MTSAITYDAIIFDLDGTLIDSERPALLSAQRALSDMGFDVSMDFLTSLIGISDTDVAPRLNAHLNADLDYAAYEAAFARAHTHRRDTRLRPHVADILPALSAPLAVATSSRRLRATEKLTDAGIAQYFATVVTADCVAAHKPDPAPFVEAANRLQADPARCLAIEDSPPGVAAALAAGMTVVHVPDMLVPETSPAHHFTQDLRGGLRAAGLLL